LEVSDSGSGHCGCPVAVGFFAGQGGGGGLRVSPDSVPAALQRWLVRPVPDDNLGQQIMREMSVYTPLLG